MKIAIVTGGTKGIGKQIVMDLLNREYFVYTNFSNDIESSKMAKLEFSKINSNFEIICADQSDNEKFRNFIDYIKRKEKKINCVICNTGATLRKPNMQIENEEWLKIMQINVNSHFYLIRDLFSLFENNSRIIFIGSMLGNIPHATSLVYGVTKSAINALSRNLVKEFEGTNTTVNVVSPGFVETEWQKSKSNQIRTNIYNKTAIKRFANVNEISNAVIFCIENGYVNGSVIEINGGYSFK